MKVQDKTMIVTGGGSGMGRELVLGLLKRKARVAAWDLNEKALQETAKLAGNPDPLLTAVVNVTDRKAIEAATRAAVERFGAIDGAINCAGIIQPFVRLSELDDATVERVFDVNWKGTLNVTRTLLPLLLARPVAHLVNVSSMGGFMPVPGQTIYCASKAAVKMLTEGLHAELENTNVRVTVVFPGAVATNIKGNSGLASAPGEEAQRSKILQPADAARQMLDGVERDAFRVLVGKDARFLDLIYRLNPRRAAAFMAKQLKSLLPQVNT